MAISDISKSLVHIEERFIQRGQITTKVHGAIPATTSGSSNTFTVTATGVKQGDTVFVQPAFLDDPGTTTASAANLVANLYIKNAYVTAADTVTVEFLASGANVAAVSAGTAVAPQKVWTVTTFARGW
jgi:hypothetical protein